MSRPDSPPRRWQTAGWLLALTHTAVALALLALSGWFIAASALAGALGLAAHFNYVVPSTLIRLLAFTRVLSGYGERYVGHLGLLRRLGEVREGLFRRLVVDRGVTPSAEALDRVEEDADALASLWVRIWHPLGSLAMVLVSLGVVFLVWWPSVFPIWLGFSLAVVGVLALAWRGGRRQAHAHLLAEADLRSHWLDWSRSAPIWTLMADRGAATRPQSAWERWQEAHLTEEALAQRLDHGLSVLGWLAVLALGVYVYRLSPDVVGQALLLVPILICLAARDWLSGAARALPELSRLPLRRSRVEALLADPGSKAESFPPQPGNTPVDLAFEAYRWRRGDRRGLPLTIRLKSPGLILLEASSGAGKSSLFEAMLGLIPENGGWRLNGIDSQRLSAPARRAWFHLCEQFGHVFSDTLAANLRLARPEASDADCQAALRWAGLDEWATDAGLNTWIGEPGRPLSGGEQKRLILARAWLRDAPVWLIDEPFEGLDEALQERLAERLQALSRQRLLIVASHRVPSGLAPDGCIRQ